MKKLFLLLMIVMMAGCATNQTTTPKEDPYATLTLEKVSKYCQPTNLLNVGVLGNPAMIATFDNCLEVEELMVVIAPVMENNEELGLTIVKVVQLSYVQYLAETNADKAFEVMYGDRKEVQKCKWCDEEIDTDRINDLVSEQPVEVSTRSDWESNSEEYEASEFNILLCTGGPAVRIFGSCEDGYAENIELQHQDWFTPWETVHSLSDNQKDAMEWFCNFFVYS